MHPQRRLRTILFGATALAVAGCADQGLDWDLRRLGNGLDTSQAAIAARTEARPDPDRRGVISYPGYQVAVARPGDTVSDVAARVGLSAEALADYNGIPTDAGLRPDEILALPTRVQEPSPATGAPSTGPIRPGKIDVATIATDALDRAESERAPRTIGAPQNEEAAPALSAETLPPASSGQEPVRHQVSRGETAFSIARRYDVPLDALAEWNGLGEEMTVRVGQYLLIPPMDATAAPPQQPETESRPGAGTTAPEPPSAETPLPETDETPAPEPEESEPVADLSSERTEASDTARLATPVPGQIIRTYSPGQSEGIAIAAAPGTPVSAAEAGTVAAITRDTDQVPIIVIRHEGNLLTVYAGVDDVRVERGDQVSRGQTIATIRDGDPASLHFEVRDGFESVDPADYLN